jgi:RNase P subunit RPR2
MEIAEEKKIRLNPQWQPSDCESCNHPFDSKTWKPDFSMSGELTWTCPKCKHPSYPRLD